MPNTLKTFNCPNCGGALEYKGDDIATIPCPYCKSHVIVPQELRPDDEPDVVILHGDRSSGSRTIIIIAIAAVVLLLGFGIALVVNAASTAATAVSGPILERVKTEVVSIAATVTPTPGFATTVLIFGSEGTGPGLFQDARSIGIDGVGNIYVGNFSDGRIQVFDPEGNFISLFSIPPDNYLTGMAVDRQGVVYAVYGSDIMRYQGLTGELLGTVAYTDGWGFDDVAVSADGGLAAAWYKNEDRLVRFDAAWNLLFDVPNVISGLTNDSELAMRVAVDGLGNIFLLGRFHEMVFKFSPEGAYLDRFGGEGHEPGQFRAPLSIAVDGQGRVYVGDGKGVQVFDNEGRYLGLIEVDGPVLGLAFNNQNELFVAARDRVIKYVINP